MGARVTVWKYTIDPSKIDENCEVDLELPIGAKILHVGAQRDNARSKEEIRLWAKIDLYQNGPLVKRRIVVLGTGMEYTHENRNPLSPLMIYLDTVKMSDGLVFHIFELGDLEHANKRNF